MPQAFLFGKKQKYARQKLQKRKDQIDDFRGQFTQKFRAQSPAYTHPDRRGNEHGRLVKTADCVENKGK